MSHGVPRETPAPPAPDPARVGGPRGWVVSVGVLTVLGLLGLAGALVLDGGGEGALPAAGGDPAASAGAWTAATLGPPQASPAGSDPAGSTPGSAGPAGAATSGPASEPPASEPAASAASPSAAGASPALTAISAADRSAGIATTRLVQAGTGRLVPVPGSAAAPGPGPRMTVRVEVEEGIGIDGPAFADFVLRTLNDPRSWGHGGTLTFARTSGTADIRVIIASPDTSARLCAPMQTHGTLSCGGGDQAVLTMYRWMNGTPDYGSDLTEYRHYVVNHEVGHVLGHAHAYCDPGHLAPVMVQQSKGLHGCLPNAWPFPATS